MWNAMKGLACAVALLALAAMPAHAQNKLTAGSSWRNELGSILTITNISASGLMTGTYTTAVGCRAGTPQPMTGWYYAGSTGGAMTFTVNWTGCNSLTSWTGQYDYSKQTITTLWYLSAASAPAWNGINAGADTFVYVGASTAKMKK